MVGLGRVCMGYDNGCICDDCLKRRGEDELYNETDNDEKGDWE